VLGGAALGLELAYVARVPVIAGALSLAAALACVAVFAIALERRSRVILAVIACAAASTAVLPIARAPSAPPVAANARSASAVDPGDAGGIEVRARIWRASVHMLGEHPLFGVGPGQFAVWFPAHRDGREIELSTLSRRSGTETEVEHPHNDWLAVWLETRLAGGWLASRLRSSVASVPGRCAPAMPPRCRRRVDPLFANALCTRR
jgi:O-antigen ligase